MTPANFLRSATFAGIMALAIACDRNRTSAVAPREAQHSQLLRHDSWDFSPGQVDDLESLATRLKRPQESDGISQFVYTQLQESTRRIMSNYSNGPSPSLARALAIDLTRIIHGPPIYEPRRFAGVKLSFETQHRLRPEYEVTEEPHADAVAHLNRLLLEDAYPGELSSLHANRARLDSGVVSIFMSRSSTSEQHKFLAFAESTNSESRDKAIQMLLLKLKAEELRELGIGESVGETKRYWGVAGWKDEDTNVGKAMAAIINSSRIDSYAIGGHGQQGLHVASTQYVEVRRLVSSLRKGHKLKLWICGPELELHLTNN